MSSSLSMPRKKDLSWKIILFFVVLLHASLISAAYFFSEWKKNAPSSKRLAVQTLHLRPQPQKVALSLASPDLPVVNQPIAQPKKESFKQNKPETAKKTVKPAPVKKTKTKPKTTQKAPTPTPKTQLKQENGKLRQKQKTLLSQARAKMDKINQQNIAMGSAALIAPQKIQALKIDHLSIDTSDPLNQQEISYRDELASRLKSVLKLPEDGVAEIKLTLNRQGQVIRLQVLQTASSANKSYLEKTMPNLKMPPFGKNFGNEAEYTFIINMSNS